MQDTVGYIKGDNRYDAAKGFVISNRILKNFYISNQYTASRLLDRLSNTELIDSSEQLLTIKNLSELRTIVDTIASERTKNYSSHKQSQAALSKDNFIYNAF